MDNYLFIACLGLYVACLGFSLFIKSLSEEDIKRINNKIKKIKASRYYPYFTFACGIVCFLFALLLMKSIFKYLELDLFDTLKNIFERREP